MSFPKTFFLLPAACCVLVACGGGGGGSDAENKTPSEMIASAASFNDEALKTAAQQLVADRYSGKTAPAEMDIVLAQTAFKYLSEDGVLNVPTVDDYGFVSDVDNQGNLNVTHSCDFQGEATYKGKVEGTSELYISINYRDCINYGNDYALTGNMALVAYDTSKLTWEIQHYYDNLILSHDNQQAVMTGYVRQQSARNVEDGYKVKLDFNLLADTQGKQLLFNGRLINDQQIEDAPLEYSGDFFISDKGKITVSFDQVFNSPPYLNSGYVNFSGDKVTRLNFDNYPYVLYEEDSNNDKEVDQGAYFKDVSELLTGDASAKALLAISELSLPPYAGRPWFASNEPVYTTTPIEVTEGSYDDPDTPSEELKVSYRWYINGDIVEGQNGNILPAYLAVYGDDVQVSMLVSDGINLIESDPGSIEISDSPAIIQPIGLPATIAAGAIVEFTAKIIDPDLQDSSLDADLVAAPDNVTVSDGTFVWQTPEKLFFEKQDYIFTFGAQKEDGTYDNINTAKISVTSDEARPIARTSIAVPSKNKSITVGDFDGDGENEVLSTNGKDTVFLLKYSDGKYLQKWAYPYKITDDGEIVQVIANDYDQDGSLEVIVVNEHGISLLKDTGSVAVSIYQTSKFIRLVEIGDLTGDGYPDIAVLEAQNSYSHETDRQLKVFSVNKPEEILFSTSVSQAVDIAFANVDQDAAVELILNNGLIYDSADWSNQWFYGDGFGSSSLVVGDFNGDGIAEIAAVTSDDNLVLYDAVNKVKTASKEDAQNVCGLHSININESTQDELIVGSCWVDKLVAYQLNNGGLEQLWNVQFSNSGMASLTSGDADNDGKFELLWSSGTSNSGDDQLITADIDNSEATIKTSATTSLLDTFTSAGWSNITTEQERAVFLAPETESGYGGSKIITINEQGDYSISHEISSNWDNSHYAVTTDYNKDGYGDIFLPTTEIHDGRFSVMQLSDYSIHWHSNSDYDNTIGLIKAIDFNGDGYDDALYTDSKNLKIIDIYNQTVIANNAFDSPLKDFVAWRNDESALAVVSSADKVSVLSLSNNMLSEVSSIQQNCSKLATINYDMDPALEILCLNRNNYDWEGSITIYDLAGNELVEVARRDLKQKVIDLAVDPSRTSQQNIFTISFEARRFDKWDISIKYHLQKTSALGEPIWSSPALVGVPAQHSLKVRTTAKRGLELLLSTDKAMYWLK